VQSRYLKDADPEVFGAIEDEVRRQAEEIELIASENFASHAVLEATGSVMTNKYAEGYPGRRYYDGCENVDRVEELARSRAMALFGAEHANVQPHSGTQANMAVYFTVLSPGDDILSMDLAHGGDDLLVHGFGVFRPHADQHEPVEDIQGLAAAFRTVLDGLALR